MDKEGFKEAFDKLQSKVDVLEKVESEVTTSFTIDTDEWKYSVQNSETKSTNQFLRVVTWNIWFDPHYQPLRFNKLILCLLDRNPDVICLQEVTTEVAALIRSSIILGSIYSCSENSIRSYGVLILAKKQLGATFKEVLFEETFMDRSLLIAELNPSIDDESLSYLKDSAIATVHLESLNSKRARQAQLLSSNRELSKYKNVILCGDFNFDDTQEWGDWRKSAAKESRSSQELENNVLNMAISGYRDMWRMLRPNERGATFNGSENGCCHDKLEIMRYDRMMLKHSRGSSWVASCINMLGTEALKGGIEDSGAVLKISDHYGLELDLTGGDVRNPPMSWLEIIYAWMGRTN